MKKTQKDVILEHLQEHETITSFEAIQKYGITRLSSVIYLLKADGHNISSKLKTVKTRYRNTQVSEYKLCD